MSNNLRDRIYRNQQSTPSSSGSGETTPSHSRAKELRMDEPFILREKTTPPHYPSLPNISGSRIPRRRPSTSSCPCGSHLCEQKRTVRCPCSMTSRVPCIERGQMCLVGLLKHVSEAHVPAFSGKECYNCYKCGFHTDYVDEFMRHALNRKCRLITNASIFLIFALNQLDDGCSNFLGELRDLLHQAVDNLQAESLLQLQEAPASPTADQDSWFKEDFSSDVETPRKEELGTTANIENLIQIPSTTTSSFELEDDVEPRTPTYLPPEDDFAPSTENTPTKKPRVAEAKSVLKIRTKSRLPLPRQSQRDDQERPYTPNPTFFSPSPNSNGHLVSPIAPSRFVNQNWTSIPPQESRLSQNRKNDNCYPTSLGQNQVNGDQQSECSRISQESILLAESVLSYLKNRSDLLFSPSQVMSGSLERPETYYGSHLKNESRIQSKHL